MVLDTDTTIHTLLGNHMGARKSHNPKNKRKKSYQPVLTFLAETTRTFRGGSDGFVAKLDPSGAAFGGQFDAFAAVLGAAGGTLDFASYMGGAETIGRMASLRWEAANWWLPDRLWRALCLTSSEVSLRRSQAIRTGLLSPLPTRNRCGSFLLRPAG